MPGYTPGGGNFVPNNFNFPTNTNTQTHQSMSSGPDDYFQGGTTIDKSNMAMSNNNGGNNNNNNNINIDLNSSKNIPVKYRICWSKTTSAFTITLLVPVPVSGSNLESPFQKIQNLANGKPNYGANGEIVDTFALRIPLSYFVDMASKTAASPARQQAAPWLDRSTLRNRLNDGGRAIGLEQSYVYQSIAAVEESASKLPQWSPGSTDTVNVEVVLSEGSVTLLASVPNTDQHSLAQAFETQNSLQPTGQFNVLNETSGGLLATAPSFPAPGESFSVPRSQPFSANGANTHRNSETKPLYSTFSSSRNVSEDSMANNNALGSSFSSWGAYSSNSNIGQQQHSIEQVSSLQGSRLATTNSSGLPDGAQIYQPPRSNHTSHHSQIRNQNGSSIGLDNQSRPDPSSIIEPLLKMGFNQEECEAAANAIRNIYLGSTNHNPSSHTSGGGEYENSNLQQGQKREQQVLRSESYDQDTNNTTPKSPRVSENLDGGNILDYVLNNSQNKKNAQEEMSLPTNSSNMLWGSSNFKSNHQAHVEESNLNSKPDTVWGNAGKMKLIKSSTSDHDDRTVDTVDNPSTTNLVPVSSSSINSVQQAQAQKMVKVLDIPPELNAFVFHCNANTREECLERGLFGCPSGGQYGPHSKAKKGDLLFLADFSAWTVSGIFIAKSDAGLNIEKSAWAGRFPWQIKVDEYTELRTVHIDKVNEIIGLASGSKLNMLTKDQLVQLVSSKEFGPCVPAYFFKTKSTAAQQSLPASSLSEGTLQSSVEKTSDENIADSTDIPTRALGINGIKYHNLSWNSDSMDEHPATAMRRLKLVTSWFDNISGEILAMNEIHNNKKSSPKKEKLQDKVTLDEELLTALKNENGQSWPSLNFAHVRKAVADLFDQWLFQSHVMTNEEVRNRRTAKPNSSPGSESGSWTRQLSKSASNNGKNRDDAVLLLHAPGGHGLITTLLQSKSGASSLAVPTKILADVLASKFVREVEQIAVEVRKTQASLLKIGGDDFHRSVEDKALGMRTTEVSAKSFNEEGEKIDRKLIRIEWHTKSSIAQGRPPQVQKIYKQNFDMLERMYQETTLNSDPEKNHLLSRMFVLLCRYDLIGDIKNRCQAYVPLKAFKAMSDNFGVTHECFASPLYQLCSSYNSYLFSDVDKFFGGLGSFFDFLPIEGSFEVNPPFGGNSLKLMFDRIFTLLQRSDNDKNALSFLVVTTEVNGVLQHVKSSPYFRRGTKILNKYSNKLNVHHKDTGPASRKISKVHDDAYTVENGNAWSSSRTTLLIWLQNDFGHDLWTPSDEKVNSVLKGFGIHSKKEVQVM